MRLLMENADADARIVSGSVTLLERRWTARVCVCFAVTICPAAKWSHATSISL